jgi:hypothetical protein
MGLGEYYTIATPFAALLLNPQAARPGVGAWTEPLCICR